MHAASAMAQGFDSYGNGFGGDFNSTPTATIMEPSHPTLLHRRRQSESAVSSVSSASSSEEDALFRPLESQCAREGGQKVGANLEKLEKYLQLRSDQVNDYVDLIVGESNVQKRLKEAATLKKTFNPNAKFTLYTLSTKLLQGDVLPIGNSGFSSLKGELEKECFWLDITGPSEADLRVLSSIFDFHPLTTEDIAHHETREKAEHYDSYVFTIFKTFISDPTSESYLSEIPYYIIIFPHFLISLHYPPTPHTLNVVLRLETFANTFTPDWVTYALLDDITNSFSTVVKAMEYDVDCIDDLVLILHENEQSDMLRRIRGASKKVTQLLRLMHFKVEVVKSLGNRGRFGRPSTTLYLRDIRHHLLTLHYTLTFTSDKLHNAHTIYLSQISVELASSANDTNEIMKKLNGFAGIFLPITFVTSLFGMNVPIPGQTGNPNEPLTWFISLSSGMLVFSVVFYSFAKKYRLL